jgi:negative regulator of sigma E activity
MSEQLKKKMYQWEAIPPPVCWDTIASRLDDAVAPVTTRLRDLELSPPSSSWSLIVQALELPAPVKARVKTFTRNLFRIAVAAIIVLLVTAGWIWVINLPADKRKPQIAAPAPASNHLPVPGNTIVDNSGQDNEDNTATPRSYTGKSNTAHKPVPSNTRLLKYASVSIQPAHQVYPIKIDYASPPGDDNGTVIRNMDPSLANTEYILLNCPNGQTTRASVKMADALRYLYSEPDTDDAGAKVNNENKPWKKRLQDWRNKIISAHFIPASNNFLDIIDLKDLLIDEKP